jgi:hypothetical protein
VPLHGKANLVHLGQAAPPGSTRRNPTPAVSGATGFRCPGLIDAGVPTEGSGMDPVVSAGSSLSAWQRRLADSPAAGALYAPASSPFAAEISAAADIPALLDPANRADPQREQELMAHFMSHVSADCFVSLLQTMDPMPYDEIKRAEWRRFYSQLHDSLIVPGPPSE